MLRSLLTPHTSLFTLNIGSLILRLGFGLLMTRHGLGKLEKFESLAPKFIEFMGLNGTISLSLAIFAELFCAILVSLGLMTRAALIPLIITMLVAAFVAHGGDPLAKKELSLAFLSGYLAILFLGPGKYSLDAVIFKRSNSL